jgi:hypothetical protein
LLRGVYQEELPPEFKLFLPIQKQDAHQHGAPQGSAPIQPPAVA